MFICFGGFSGQAEAGQKETDKENEQGRRQRNANFTKELTTRFFPAEFLMCHPTLADPVNETKLISSLVLKIGASSIMEGRIEKDLSGKPEFERISPRTTAPKTKSK